MMEWNNRLLPSRYSYKYGPNPKSIGPGIFLHNPSPPTQGYTNLIKAVLQGTERGGVNFGFSRKVKLLVFVVLNTAYRKV